MANISLQSITFPGLSNRYTIPQVDNTLAVTGAAADAKKVGDEISDLKDDLKLLGFDIGESLVASEQNVNWALNGTGLAVANTSAVSDKFAVNPGDELYLKLSGDTDGTYQWQNTSYVPSAGTNSGLIGDPVNGKVDCFVTVPEGATYLIVSRYKTNTSNIVAYGSNDILKIEQDVATLNQSISAKANKVDIDAKANKIAPLFIDTIADFNWVSKHEVTAFSSNNSTYADGTSDGNNGFFSVAGDKGNNYVTVGSGGNADLSVLTSTDKSRWLSGILIYDNGHAQPINFYYKSDTQLHVYPSLKEDMTSGQLGNIQTGIHLSKRGYKGYAQHLWRINPKHCEKSKYIAKYRPNDEIPFTKYGGNVYTGIDNRMPLNPYQNRYAQIAYIMYMPWGSTQWHTTETGITWEVDIAGKSGYFEAFVGSTGVGENDASVNIDSYMYEYDNGAEIHCEMYVDGILVDDYVKTTKRLERVCLDFGNGNKARIKIYSNSWNVTNYGFTLGAMTWWVNEVWTSNDNPYLFKNIGMFFDSWGDFQGQAVQNEIESLHGDVIGTPVPVVNCSGASGRSMTSQWGRLWFYEDVISEKPAIMISDFGINDYNSSITSFPDEVAPDGESWPVQFTKESYAESMNKLLQMALRNNIIPVVAEIGSRLSQGYNVYEWIYTVIDGYAEQI